MVLDVSLTVWGSYGTLTILNDTHASWSYNRAADGTVTDGFILSRQH